MTGAPRSAPWLVVIDMQTVFGDPESGWYTPRFEEARAGIRRLMPAFGDRVVHTRFEAPVRPSGAWVAYYEQWPWALVPGDSSLYDLVDQPDATHRLVTETTFGKWGPVLEAATAGSRELVLAGVSTDCCVISTALPAADAGVHVRIATDACAGATDADHARALDAMALYAPLIELTDVDAVLATLDR
ncbi:cysteine hydrolase family protein [Humibacter ginsenosidimutans]|uniref:Cysteine hydrolase n=1 Tax=Humibacter ginsenosidimutans TaxID=2599293 RepID=A0A5B8M5R1_9MICO|nr:cysteine hydrolase [Humibacter ginsenosidimutans]QDZ14810.1 cysteine hydrolase [Humibacter ginsenosidimutans]